MNADRRIVGVDAFIAFPFSPLATLRAIAYKETTDRGGVGVWGTGRRIKVERDLDPDIARTGDLGVWQIGRVELEPPSSSFLEFLGEDLARYGQRSGRDASTVVRLMAE